MAFASEGPAGRMTVTTRMPKSEWYPAIVEIESENGEGGQHGMTVYTGRDA